ncbi:MAG TPA: decarboxylating 6-phosphogluconate dehydrogenase [Anaerolineaceae bacterium]|nr:decarboxylating 6-phosphogluconate dehydrogenase [Anaerolineaceae bacterium]
MKIAFVGLGRMGGNMVRRLRRAGHPVIGFNRTESVTRELAEETGMIPAFSLEEVVNLLEPRRAVWVMMPAGEVTETMLDTLSGLLSLGDILIDGGNSNFHDTIRRGKQFAERGIRFVDVGTSGGVWGLEAGYSMMVGGDEESVAALQPVLSSLAPEEGLGWGRVGPNGAGHFVKMVHNGIEYGMMEAFAEGFELMRAEKSFDLDLHEVAEIWRYGSVVRSWLLDLIALALKDDPDLAHVDDWVADSGEGRWTVLEAIANDVPAPVIALSLFQRFRSRQDQSYSAKLLAAMRNQFGGHEIRTIKE